MNRISSGLAALALIAVTACHQHERPEPKWEISSKRLEVQGKQELIFTLPENLQQEAPFISSLPSNAAAAELILNSSGEWALRFQSADGKAGVDNLSIDSEGGHGSAPHCGGGLKHGHKHNKKEIKGLYRLQLKIAVTEVKDALRKPAMKTSNQ